MEWTLPSRSTHYRELALKRQSELTKPTGALGELESIAIWLADIQQSETPTAESAAAIVFASDHPVSLLGVSAYPREVTPMMVVNLAAGGAAASVLARINDIPLYVVDVGAEPYPAPNTGEDIYWTKTELGGVVGDLVNTDAMDNVTIDAALAAGARAIDALPASTKVVILGEMGIGNTTPASAIAARLLGISASEMVGPGTGVSGEALQAKTAIVQAALERSDCQTPMEVLRCLGGREIAALVGAIGRAAERGMALLIDGFIVSSAALVAVKQQSALRDYMCFGHRSAEPGHQHILESLAARPIVDAGLRLGEASGALTALPLIRAATALHNQMATFAEAAVPDRDH